jgi:hypothetical protein
MMKINPDDFYEGDSLIVCGDCLLKALAKTERGIYTGDEAIEIENFELLTDADIEPYQCDDCLKQSKGYDYE